jgi:hypothetical protein
MVAQSESLQLVNCLGPLTLEAFILVIVDNSGRKYGYLQFLWRRFLNFAQGRALIFETDFRVPSGISSG